MLTLIGAFILCVVTVVVEVFGLIDIVGQNIINTVGEIFVLMLCGGTATFVESINHIRYRKTKKMNFNQLEILLNTNEDLRTLFTQYASNEYSVENIKAFEMIRQFSNDYTNMEKNMTLSEMMKFEKEFIVSYPRFELNISSVTKKRFYELLDSVQAPSLTQLSTEAETSDGSFQVTTQRVGVKVSELMDVIGVDLMLNLNDTFSRLQKTAQYDEWEYIYKLQKHTNNTTLP